MGIALTYCHECRDERPLVSAPGDEWVHVSAGRDYCADCYDGLVDCGCVCCALMPEYSWDHITDRNGDSWCEECDPANLDPDDSHDFPCERFA